MPVGRVPALDETDEQTMIREVVRRVAASYGHGYFVKCAREGRSADELWTELASAGMLGVSIPEAYGGGGQGMSELAIVCEELAAEGCPLLLLAVSPGIAGTVIAAHGSEEQRQRWLPGLASGELKIAFALTEPDAGSNSHNLATLARKDGDGYRITGKKYYISGADEADYIVLVTRTGTDERSGRGQLSLFVIDGDTPGMEKVQIPVEVIAPERQYTLFFDDVLIEADRLIGNEGDGLRQGFTGLNPERITVAAMSCGLGRYALEKAADYAAHRQVWDVPIGAHQGIAHPLAEAWIQVELARQMTRTAAVLYDRGLDAGGASNVAKLAAADASLAAIDQAIQTHGGNGMASEYELADLWGLARLFRIVPVSREMILNHVAQHELGLPRSY